MYQHMMLMNISNDLTTLVKKVGNLAVAVLVSFLKNGDVMIESLIL